MKNKVKLSLVVFLMVILGCFTSVLADSTGGKYQIKNNVAGYNSTATYISLDKSEISLTLGDTYILTSHNNSSYGNVLWTSSDPSIAIVDSNGKVTALKTGEATITVSTQDGSNLSTSCVVKVTELTTISLNKTIDSIKVGKEDSLSAMVSPVGVGVTWTSSDSSIVAVDASGKIKGIKSGQATITAVTSDGKIATCSVTVTEQEVNKVKLTLYIGDGVIREYNLSEDEVNDFINWYDTRSNDPKLKSYYVFNVLGKKQYILFDRIKTFDVE
ncbi:Ig-like domain-containing protein [Clostridium felsineum]|uniref:Ig-like domain-containing protein n=1 Tax=Clostridium felsineum TaxID=36839 RepID=UPI0009D38373|nr:Ig-like domain-containing protein [Clostridium felsineum]URZ00522.1 hypothetical protein CLAUR_005100 [Clostridium felsineum]